jgi:hypothetical protein
MRRTLTALVGLVLTVPLAAAPATAGEPLPGPSGRADVVAKRLLSPLSLDVTQTGTAWFSQNFAGRLMRQREGGPARAVYTHRKGAEVGAVSARGRTATFAITTNSGRTALMAFTRADGVRKVAGLSRVEARRNPDAVNRYGLMGLSESCKEQVPPFLVDYEGIVESHPYASLTMGGLTYVADAAANAIFSVARDGRVRVLAVLPAQDPITVTQEAAEANELPPCVVGKEFVAEPVPTDVEAGPDGMLYVTTLPGGPEDPSLGARGGVYRIDPATGDLENVADGLMSATGLAVAPSGDLFVAELFGNRISRIPAGSSSPVSWVETMMPGDVEYAEGSIWATRKVLTGLSGDKPAGQVVRYQGGVPTLD